MSEAKQSDSTAELGVALPLVTYDADGRRESVRVGDTVSVCVRRSGARSRQMYWYAATVISIEGAEARVALKKHPGERALLGAKNIRVRKPTPNTEVVRREAPEQTES